MGFLGGALGPVLGGLLGSGMGGLQGLMAGNGPQFTARDAQVDPTAFQWGGQTAEQAQAGQAQGYVDALTAAQQTADFFNKHRASDEAPWDGTGHHVDASGLNGPLAQAKAQAEAAAKKAAEAGTMAEREARRNEMRGDAAAGRAAPQLDTRNIDQARALNDQARGRVSGALDMYQQAAEGKAPSAAQGILQMGLDRNNAAQRSFAAGAKASSPQRGELLSQALANAGQANAQTAQQSAILRAQEMEAARAGYLQGGLGLRQGDAQRQGLDLQQSSTQAGLQSQQNALNDAQQRFYEGQRSHVQDEQFAANQKQAQLNQQGIMHADDVNSRVAGAQADAAYRNAGMITGGAMGGVDAGAKIAQAASANPSNPIPTTTSDGKSPMAAGAGGGPMAVSMPTPTKKKYP